MKQIHKAVQALESDIKILAAISDLVEETEKRRKKNTRQIPQGQYAYCKYLEIIRVGVFESEQKQAAAGGLRKNNKSPPPHSGWRLKNTFGWTDPTIRQILLYGIFVMVPVFGGLRSHTSMILCIKIFLTLMLRFQANFKPYKFKSNC